MFAVPCFTIAPTVDGAVGWSYGGVVRWWGQVETTEVIPTIQDIPDQKYKYAFFHMPREKAR